uniref:Uncharacterized protein n=1 Tax=Arundo donax TaxID=35708 RepID=A0A0A9GWW2_ARUDO
MCPNHLKRYWTSFYSIGATPTYHVYHHSRPDPFLCDHTSISAYASPLHSTVGHVAF